MWFAVCREAQSVIEKASGASVISKPLFHDSSQVGSVWVALDIVDEEPDEMAMDSDFEE